ncbi:hydantoinase/oxoprolinase [delta proteobacterium NaphS2]|nr:hydantoinase/oxoprolinase [delta proteobacterium NaphS2]
MGINFDIDIGGTFTDCLVTTGEKTFSMKTPTTSYDLSVGFMKALREAASLLNVSMEQLAGDIDIVRYSTTIAMNTLLQRTGPKLGLITTEGFEDLVTIGKGSRWLDELNTKEIRDLARVVKEDPPIPRELTVGVKERVDSTGKVIRPLDEDDLIEKVQYLMDQGVRGIAVSLLWAYINPVHEQKIREIIEREYPDFYLGAIPTMLSSEVCPKRWEYTRTVTTMLNCYLHQSMWEQISGMGDELRTLGYGQPIMLVHNSGGMAEVFHTSAVQTYNGGPVAGLIGGAYIGKQLGYNNIVVTDMGGTSFDLGLVVGGSSRAYQWRPIIDHWWVDITMLETQSIGAGGGSIARVNKLLNNRLEVGPLGAGSMPGPAAYDQGGTEPTVTDADLVLGYLDPDYYHGGRMALDKKKAEEAILDRIARPRQIDVVEAASLIKKLVDANMGDAILRETLLKGYDPNEFVLFAYGGAGATHCCGYGPYAGINRMIIFPFSSVFCAYGSSTMDIMHIYEQSRRVPLLAPMTKEVILDPDVFNNVVQDLQEKALRDIRGEGFAAKSIVFSLELDMKYGGQIHVYRCQSPRMAVNSQDDGKAIYDQFEHEFSQIFSPLAVNPQGGVEIHNFVLRASVPRENPELPVYPDKGSVPPKGSLRGKRDVYWEEYNRFKSTPVYQQDLLEVGNVIEGPAIVAAENTTTVLPPGQKISVDKHNNIFIEKM